jgi:HEPN domain-containing protein
MSDPSDPQSWVEKAKQDYTLIRLSITQVPILAYPAIFHAQQCAEKYLKAILVLQGVIVPRTHDLVGLHNLCLTAGVLVPVPED